MSSTQITITRSCTDAKEVTQPIPISNDGFLSPESIGRIRAPLIWTLRDLWPLTGGCHYTQGCERFTRACGACPQLRSGDPDDLSRRVYQRKAAAWQGRQLSFVALRIGATTSRQVPTGTVERNTTRSPRLRQAPMGL